MTRVRERSRGLWWLAAGVIAVGLLAARQQSAHAWWSVMAADTSTHLKIGKAAMDLLDPREFPDLARFRDLGALTPGGIQAWMSGPTDDENWDHYGPDAAAVDGYIDFMDTRNLIQKQFKIAVFYTAGVLRSVSKSLPPLVKDLAITCRTLDPTFEASIRFTLMENRTSEVASPFRGVL